MKESYAQSGRKERIQDGIQGPGVPSGERHQALLIVIVQYEPERCVQLAKIVFQNVKNGIRDMAIVISSEIKDRLHPFDSNVEVSAGL